MRIRIDFAEANKFISGEVGFDNTLEYLNIYGEELQAIICEDYFNGAELACRYMGFSKDNEYFEFEIMPN